MKNDETSAWDYIWIDIENGIFHLTVIALVAYGFALADHDLSRMNSTWILWFGLYLLVAPFMVVHVGRRSPPGDRWRAAACIAYGGAPAPLFLTPALDEWSTLVVAVPIAIAWGIVAWLQAVREKPPQRSPRTRALVMGGAAAISGLFSLPLFAGAAVGILMGVWDPPAIAWLATPVIVGICAPLAIAYAYGSAKLLGEARRAWREGAIAG